MRKRILAALLTAVLATPLLSTAPANAETPHRQCQANNNRDTDAAQLCVVGVPSTAMNAVFQYQRTPVWCWAASMAMILAYYGRPVSQRDIVTDIFGAAVPSTLPARDLVGYLDHTYVDSESGRHVTTRAALLYGAPQGGSYASLRSIVGDLESARPLLVFTPGHAMVLTALYYYADADGTPLSVAGLVVRDPYPYGGGPQEGEQQAGPGERFLSPREYYSIQYVFDVSAL